MTELTDLMKRCFWEPALPFRWNGVLTDPAKPVHHPVNMKIANKPPSTSTATAYDATNNDVVHYTQYHDVTYTDNDDNYHIDDNFHDAGEDAFESEMIDTIYGYDWNGCEVMSSVQ